MIDFLSANARRRNLFSNFLNGKRILNESLFSSDAFPLRVFSNGGKIRRRKSYHGSLMAGVTGDKDAFK